MGDGEKCAKQGDTRKMSVYGSPVLSEIMSVVWKAAEYRSFSYKLTAVGIPHCLMPPSCLVVYSSLELQP